MSEDAIWEWPSWRREPSTYNCFILDGPILVHTTFGDLLRSLDAPSALTAPLNLALSREGFVVAHFPGGHLAAFTANGNLLRHEMHNDKIQGRKTDQIELTTSRFCESFTSCLLATHPRLPERAIF